MAEVVKYGIRVDAVMIYEQWGWPTVEAGWDELNDLVGNAVLILDRVDSANLVSRKFPIEVVFEIFSLSKVLGLPGGGLCMHKGAFLEFNSSQMSAFTKALLEGLSVDVQSAPEYKDYIKGCDHAVHSDMQRWVSKNCILSAFENEMRFRQQNLKLLLDSPLSSDWPQWMVRALQHDSGPGIAPILRGHERLELQAVLTLLDTRFHLQGAIYNFNWSGNPIRPVYDTCLALPVHGEVENMHEVIDVLCHELGILVE